MYAIQFICAVTVIPIRNKMKQDLFEMDFCDQCGKKVLSSTLEENNENWYCVECTQEMDEEQDEQEQEEEPVEEEEVEED